MDSIAPASGGKTSMVEWEFAALITGFVLILIGRSVGKGDLEFGLQIGGVTLILAALVKMSLMGVQGFRWLSPLRFW
jgi:hypothetical protein